MQKVRKLKISGFRRLGAVEIEMRSFMVMIGANGVGKSSLLDAVSLLSASASGCLNTTLNALGGLVDISTRGFPSSISIEVDMESAGNEPLRYQLDIEAQGQGYAISSESLFQDRGFEQPFKHIESRYSDVRYYDVEKRRLVRPAWEHNPLETALAQVPKMFKQPEELRQTLSSATHYHGIDVRPRSPIRLPQQMKPALLPGRNGEDLVPFLYNLRESHKDRFETIEDTLKAAFPGFEGLSFPPVAAGMLTMAWSESGFKEPFYAHQLSDGTLRFLWLIALLQSPNLSTVTMIDEPEMSLHPEQLSLLADLMREASEKTQIIVATHSDRLIRFLQPSEVLVMDIGEDGCARVDWADRMDLDEWLKDYSLDDVWRMGRLGGRP